jgi:hypothetical protein
VQALLLETSVSGEITRLEIAGPAGMLTLHPGPDPMMLHGNVARPSGVDHVSLPWSPGHALLAAASPITGAVTASWLAHRIGVGEGDCFPAVEVGDDLTIRRATWRAARVSDRRWLLLAADRGVSVTVTLDDDGVLAGLEDASGWPLEVDLPA